MPTPTWTKLPAAKRRRVERAAIAEFASHPFDAANLDRIARAAGVPKGSLYQYFTDKKALHTYVVSLAMAEARSLLDGSLHRQPPRDPLDLYLRALVFPGTLRRRHPDLAQLYARAVLAAPPGGQPDAAAHNAAFQAMFFERGKGRGMLAADLDQEAAGFLLDAVSHRIHALLLDAPTAGRRSRDREAADMASRVVGLLRRAFAPHPKGASR